MSDIPTDEEKWPHVRHRKCPGCGAELRHFQLSALLMPIEQFTMPMLQQANNAFKWSIRPFGMSNINELQFLAFRSTCSTCTLISEWDFEVEEVNEIMASAPHPDYAQIVWAYNPQIIEKVLETAPDWLKPNLQALLKNLKIATPSHGEPNPS